MNRILYIFAFVLCSGVWAEAQTIADVARQERARRQAVQKSRIVVTNESLKGTTSEPATTSADKAPAEATKAPAPTGGGQDETYWRTQFKEARENVKRSEDQIVALQLELNRANTALLQRSDIYNKEVRVGGEIADLNGRLEAAKVNLEKARQRLADLEEEFRRSGAPAGWAR